MKNTLLILFASVFLLTACQKEASLEDPNSILPLPTNTSDSLLVRLVQVQGNDSIVTEYWYDASKRLIKLESDLPPFYEGFQLIRNSSGIITKIIIKGAEADAFGVDSIVKDVVYDNTLSKYKGIYYKISSANADFTDSTVFTYDGNGNLASQVSYILTPLDSSRIKVDYTYVAGNLTSSVSSDFNFVTMMYELSFTETYTYDNKLSPLKLGTEAMLFYFGYGFSINNVIKLENTNPFNPAQNYSVTNTYTYGPSGKPVSALSIYNPGTPVSRTLRLYYK